MTTTQIPSDVKKLILAGLLPLMSDIISELISDKQIIHNQVKTGNNLLRAIDPFVNEMLKGVCVQSADEQLGIQSWFMSVLKQQIDEANGVSYGLDKLPADISIEDMKILSKHTNDSVRIKSNLMIASDKYRADNEALRKVGMIKRNPPVKPITDDHMDSVIKWSSEQMNDLLSEDVMDDLLP